MTEDRSERSLTYRFFRTGLFFYRIFTTKTGIPHFPGSLPVTAATSYIPLYNLNIPAVFIFPGTVLCKNYSSVKCKKRHCTDLPEL